MKMMLGGGSRFASLGKTARAMSAAAEQDLADETQDDATGEDEAEKPDTPAPASDKDETPTDEAPKPDAAATERARVASVFASEHSQGRERQAADMLATSMSADEITGLLAKSPKVGASAGDKMLDRLATTPSPDLGAGGGGESSEANSGSAVWDRIRGRNK